MNMKWVMAAGVAGVSAFGFADTYTGSPSQDNTLYQSIDGSTSNGAGGSIFVGVTNTGDLRRALLQFDLSNIPSGATVTSATLRVTQDRQGPGGAPSLTLHRVTNSWGEGTSIGSGGGGLSTPGDATWLHRFYSTTTWDTPGGDFDAAVLSSLTSSGTGSQTFASSSAFVAAVQGWLGSPAGNNGLILKEATNTAGVAGRFYSRNNADTTVRPLLTVEFDRPTSTWTSNADGQWNVGGNWQGGVPDGFGVVARFGSAITAPRTVTNSAATTVGQIQFDSAQSYTIAGPGQIQLDNGNGFDARIDVLSGSHQIDALTETNRNVVISVAPSASLRLASFNAPASVAKQGAGTVRLVGGHLGSLTIAAGQVGLEGALATEMGGLSLSGGVLNVGRSGAFLPSTGATAAADLAARTAQIVSGSIQTTDAGLLVGIARADELGVTSFMGRSVPTPSILLRGTFAGDSNLDGAVTFDDLLSLAQHYNQLTGARWIDGDSNRDGKVDFDDLLALAQGYGSAVSREGQITVDQAVKDAFAGDWMRALALVPEPTLGLVCFAVLPCLRRRR